jgi:hypothetical protein
MRASQMSNRILVTVAGWEERFVSGVMQDITAFRPERLVIFYSTAYSAWTAEGREALSTYCKDNCIELFAFELDFKDQVATFSMLNSTLRERLPEGCTVRLNATCAPRDLIWMILHHVQTRSIDGEFSYYRALGYGEWLSRDASPPRLVLKRSGVMYPDLPTCLLILSGYDKHRMSQLVQKFEPRKVIVGVQIGRQLGNEERNKPSVNGYVEDTTYFDVDCFDATPSVASEIHNSLLDIIPKFNIVAASLGPKPSALTLFRLTTLVPEIGLVYNPAEEYNRSYSNGIDLSNATVVQI